MKTSRQDIIRDKEQTKCFNSTLIGYSTYTLRYGDFFLYTDSTKGVRFAKCHGRVKPKVSLGNEPIQYYVLAQVISQNLQSAMERWIDPKKVIEIIPAEHANEYIKNLFLALEI